MKGIDYCPHNCNDRGYVDDHGYLVECPLHPPMDAMQIGMMIATVDREQEHLRTMPYKEYLKTEHWQKTRKKALRQAEFKCQRCGAEKVLLDVHHKNYDSRGSEFFPDLQVLCRGCHAFTHGLSDDDPVKVMAEIKQALRGDA